MLYYLCNYVAKGKQLVCYMLDNKRIACKSDFRFGSTGNPYKVMCISLLFEFLEQVGGSAY